MVVFSADKTYMCIFALVKRNPYEGFNRENIVDNALFTRPKQSQHSLVHVYQL